MKSRWSEANRTSMYFMTYDSQASFAMYSVIYILPPAVLPAVQRTARFTHTVWYGTVRTNLRICCVFCTETVIGRANASSQERRNQGQTVKAMRSNPTIVSFKELNSRKVDPSLVRQSVVHYLANPERLTRMQFANLGMVSSRHCDVHLTMEVCERVGAGGFYLVQAAPLATAAASFRRRPHVHRSILYIYC